MGTSRPDLVVTNAHCEGASLTYEFELYSDADLARPVSVVRDVAEGAARTTSTFAENLAEDQTYYWRARATDGFQVSAWSAVAWFTVDANHAVPTAPIPDAPVLGARVTREHPVLVVRNSFDPDSSVLTYEVRLAEDPDMTVVIASIDGVTEGRQVTSWTTPVTLAEGATYYWRARARDESNPSPWSAVASFKAVRRQTLTVTTGGTGQGRVVSSPDGIDCGAACTAGFDESTVVTLDAIPVAGFSFSKWGGACSGNSKQCTLTMDEAKSVTAEFVSLTGFYTLTPCRVFDSRDGALGGPNPLAAGSETIVAFVGSCGVPPEARLISINVTITSPTAPGYITAHPVGVPRPLISLLNLGGAGTETKANSAVIPLGPGGELVFFAGIAQGTVHLIVDINGYFTE